MEFNVTGTCYPELHYMVDIKEKLDKIKSMIDAQKYFAINRGRQYGKTTTLNMLRLALADEYVVVSLSFQGMGPSSFSNEAAFSKMFLAAISEMLQLTTVSAEYRLAWKNEDINDFNDLKKHISKMCKGKKIVLMIDEVDQISHNLTFLSFLGVLRELFLTRHMGLYSTFHSVILAGVYDIKNIKLKMVQEGGHKTQPEETVIQNSPWNIAVGFDVDMSFSMDEIETMLRDYGQEEKIQLDKTEISKEIYHYTNGYPVLVSSICKLIDEKLDKNWSLAGVRRAVRLLLKSSDNPLFDSLIKNLTSNDELSRLVYQLVMNDAKLSFNLDNPLISLGVRYGYFNNKDGKVAISNRVFEIRLTNYFINDQSTKRLINNENNQPDEFGIISNGTFHMDIALEKFSNYYHKYYSEKNFEFHEKEARILFLMFISSVLNGSGFAELESGLADGRSMDIVANYLGKQFILETKLWYGENRHREGYEQLLGYMDKMNLTEGYLLTFDLRKEKRRQAEWVILSDGRKIFDVRV